MTAKLLPRIATLALLTGALMMAGVVSASAKPAAVTKPTAVSGTINLLVSASQRKGWEIVIANFERVYPDVKVNAQYVVGGSTAQKSTLFTQLQAGPGPDVFIAYPGNGVSPSVVELQKAGYLESLAGSPWVKRDPAWIGALTNVNKKPYMLELGVQMGGILYNTDKFRQLGLKVPTTFGQLLTLCRTIKQKSPETIPIAFAGSLPALVGPVVTMLAVSDVFSQDPDWNAKRVAGKTTFAQSRWRTSLQKIVDMKSASCFAPSVAGDDLPSTIRQNASGQALMQIANTANFGLTLAAAPNVKFALFGVPGTTTKQTRMVVFPGSGVALNARSPNKETARTFLNFLARVKQNDVFVRADGYGQIAPYHFEHAEWPALYKPLLPLAKKTVTTPFYFWPTGTTFATLGTSVQGLLTGQKTVDQVLSDLDNSWGK